MYIFHFSSFVILATLATSSLGAESLDFYRKLALTYSPRLQAQVHKTAAAKGDYLRESVFKENPNFSVGVINVPLNTFPSLNQDQMTGIAIGISQKIALPWEDHYRKQQGLFRAESSERDHSLLQAQINWEIAENYNAIHYNYQRERSLREGKNIMVRNLNILARQVKLQRNIVSQILEARANLAALDNDLIKTEFDLKKLWLNLEYLCGKKLAHELTASEKESWSKVKITRNYEQAFTPAQNLQFRRVKADVDSQVAALSLSKAALFPEVTISAVYSNRQPVPGRSDGNDMISLSASTPLPVFYPLKNRHEINAAEEKKNYMEQMLKETELQIEAAWQTEVLRLDSLKRAIDNYTNAILPAHSSAHRTHLATATTQGAGVSEVLQSYQMIITAEQEKLRLVRDFYSAANKLEYLSAGDHNEK
jgi:outer membrane protein, heavy metal efflux system